MHENLFWHAYFVVKFLVKGFLDEKLFVKILLHDF